MSCLYLETKGQAIRGGGNITLPLQSRVHETCTESVQVDKLGGHCSTELREDRDFSWGWWWHREKRMELTDI